LLVTLKACLIVFKVRKLQLHLEKKSWEETIIIKINLKEIKQQLALFCFLSRIDEVIINLKLVPSFIV